MGAEAEKRKEGMRNNKKRGYVLKRKRNEGG
jgi:hypothetical protein